MANFRSIILCSLYVLGLYPYFAALAENVADTSTSTCIPILEIEISPDNIYSDYEHISLVKKALDLLHFTTRSSVVEKELLFKKGDCFDKSLVNETERNLRDMGIFSYVDIYSHISKEGVVLTVATSDKFTLRLELSASQAGSQTKTRISVGEKNLFGLNKRFHFSKTGASNKKTKNRFSYTDPRIFQTHALKLLHETKDTKVTQLFGFSNPFRAFSDKHAYDFQYLDNNADTLLTVPNESDIDIPKRERSVSIAYAQEIGSDIFSKRAGFKFSNQTLRYFPETAKDPIPENVFVPNPLETNDFDASYHWSHRVDFIKTKGLDSLISQEDISLHNSFGLKVGVQQRKESKETEYHSKFGVTWGYSKKYSDHYLSSFRMNADTRFYRDDLREIVNSAFYHGYYFPSESQTYVGSMTYMYQFNRDALNIPLSLGADIGLRGHDVGSITGNKILLFNFEHRYRFPSKSQNIAFGQALFVDAGYAWERNQNINLREIEVDVGYGVRVNIPSILGEKLLRFDIGVNLATPPVSG